MSNPINYPWLSEPHLSIYPKSNTTKIYINIPDSTGYLFFYKNEIGLTNRYRMINTVLSEDQVESVGLAIDRIIDRIDISNTYFADIADAIEHLAGSFSQLSQQPSPIQLYDQLIIAILNLAMLAMPLHKYAEERETLEHFHLDILKKYPDRDLYVCVEQDF